MSDESLFNHLMRTNALFERTVNNAKTEENEMQHDHVVTSSMSTGAGAQDRPDTQLDVHIGVMGGAISGLERALLQYENLLARLRGSQPEVQGLQNNDKVPHHNGMLDELSSINERVGNITSRLNNAADELNGLL